MDCNRDEAARSKSIAEQKFRLQDYAGAKKFALKARQLYPDLEGLVQFLAVVEVHAVAHAKLLRGEKDLYGILQSDPSADEASLRKQYRKLALVLHPDKNKFLGAEAAFKYVSEAWTILSDKVKKAAYDSKRQPQAAKPVPAKKSGHASQNKRAEKPPPKKKQAPKAHATGFQPQQSPSTPPHVSSPGITFWTSCPDCKLQYEYQIVYKNKKLCCPFCFKAFFAKELAVVTSGALIWPPLQEQNGVDAVDRGKPSSGNNYSCGATLKMPPATAAFPHEESSHDNSEVRKENIKVPLSCASTEELSEEMDQSKSDCRGAMESDPFPMGENGPPFAPTEQLIKEMDQSKKDCVEAGESDPVPMEENVAMGQNFAENKSSEDDYEVLDNALHLKSTVFSAGKDSTLLGKEGCGVGVPFVDLESDPYVSPPKKARVDCQSSLQEQDYEEILKKMPFQTDCMLDTDSLVAPGVKALNQDCAMADYDTSYTQDTWMDCDLLEYGFHVFDNDRTESHFASGQVWACYDDDDGLPRYYAHIVKVISEKPFKLQYTWLEVRSSSEQVMLWLDAGFSYTCGEFKLGKTLTGDSKGMFSHIMTFEKAQNGGFIIYPRKGEVWALYKDWNRLITKDDKHGYEIVEVLAEFSAESGTQVCLLVKVDGFKSVFQQQPEVVYNVLPNQMQRFSHNIPVQRLESNVLDSIKGWLELDPAAIPRN